MEGGAAPASSCVPALPHGRHVLTQCLLLHPCLALAAQELPAPKPEPLVKAEPPPKAEPPSSNQGADQGGLLALLAEYDYEHEVTARAGAQGGGAEGKGGVDSAASQPLLAVKEEPQDVPPLQPPTQGEGPHPRTEGAAGQPPSVQAAAWGGTGEGPLWGSAPWSLQPSSRPAPALPQLPPPASSTHTPVVVKKEPQEPLPPGMEEDRGHRGAGEAGGGEGEGDELQPIINKLVAFVGRSGARFEATVRGLKLNLVAACSSCSFWKHGLREAA